MSTSDERLLGDSIKLIAQLRAENERLVDTLNEWGEAYKKIINDSGCSDEQHCSCVPVLRAELAAANKAVDEARILLEEYCFAGDSVGLDYKSEEWLTAHPEGKKE